MQLLIVKISCYHCVLDYKSGSSDKSSVPSELFLDLLDYIEYEGKYGIWSWSFSLVEPLRPDISFVIQRFLEELKSSSSPIDSTQRSSDSVQTFT